MFRTTIAVDEKSEVNAVLRDLRARCERAGVNSTSVEMLLGQVEQLLTQLGASGKMLAAQGSQLKVTREVVTDECAVDISFGAGIPESSWRKFSKRLFGK